VTSTAPLKEHIRTLPIDAEALFGSGAHTWPGLPQVIAADDLPAVCVTLAARLADLSADDAVTREAHIRLITGGDVVIQSIGSAVLGMSVTTG
jgi:hypothetical protein